MPDLMGYIASEPWLMIAGAIALLVIGYKLGKGGNFMPKPRKKDGKGNTI